MGRPRICKFLGWFISAPTANAPDSIDMESATASLMARFPTVDRVTIEETLTMCDGDADKVAATLAEVLAEEAAAEQPTMLRTLFDAVSMLAQLPAAEQPAAQRDRVLMLCGGLEMNGIRLLQPVAKMLDGVRDPAALTAGLDEADRVVALQLLELVREGGNGTVDGLTVAERKELAAEYGTAAERAEAVELERLLNEKRAELLKKGQQLTAMKEEVERRARELADDQPVGQ